MKTTLCSLVLAAASLSACGDYSTPAYSPPPAPPTTPAAPALSVAFEIKQLRFTWTGSSGVDSYRLLQNLDGVSGFTQLGSNMAATILNANVGIAVHGLYWPSARYALDACNSAGCTRSNEVSIATGMLQAIGYFKASNAEAGDIFGFSMALSGDGNTLAVGAPNEDSVAMGINGSGADNSAQQAGAVYVFARSDGGWSQQAYIKASNTEPEIGFASGDFFGLKLALSGDGNTLAVGAHAEDSAAMGINGNQGDNSAQGAGAAYVFVRNGGTWTQQAYIKASNAGVADGFGTALAMSGDGSGSVGANGNQADNSAPGSGAVYVFVRNGGTWSQEVYLKASNTETSDFFGFAVSLSSDGRTLAVGARQESSSATGINGNQVDNSAVRAGAVYVFTRAGSTWSQQAYIKASNPETLDEFGFSVSLSDDGNVLMAGARGEDSAATGVGGNQSDNSAPTAGAAYIFARSGTSWLQQAYVKSSNSTTGFGSAVALSADGRAFVVGGILESSSATGINGNQSADISTLGAGAAYYFTVSNGNWSQRSYIKASNTEGNDQFGISVALSGDGSTLAVSAVGEDSAATGINGNQSDNSAAGAGGIQTLPAILRPILCRS